MALLMRMFAATTPTPIASNVPKEPPAPRVSTSVTMARKTVTARVACRVKRLRLNASFFGGWRRLRPRASPFPINWAAIRPTGLMKKRPTTSGNSLMEKT